MTTVSWPSPHTSHRGHSTALRARPLCRPNSQVHRHYPFAKLVIASLDIATKSNYTLAPFIPMSKSVYNIICVDILSFPKLSISSPSHRHHRQSLFPSINIPCNGLLQDSTLSRPLPPSTHAASCTLHQHSILPFGAAAAQHPPPTARATAQGEVAVELKSYMARGTESHHSNIAERVVGKHNAQRSVIARRS